MNPLDAKKDHYRKLARKEGYRSRSAFKLFELNNKYHIIKKGSYVLDIGCAPGGWLQASLKLTRDCGKIMGIDISNIDEINGTYFLQKNIESNFIVDDIFHYFGKKVNSFICDISPHIVGKWSMDHIRQISLSYTSIKIMDKTLDDGGNALFKIFDGEYSNEFRNIFKKKFKIFKATKPSSSRKASSELYFVGLNYQIK